ncbi:MAG: PAC2 family protein [Thermoplasmata archaeon]|nr:PAC2 family protein [Thermoplasmata archaeon]
MALDIRRYPGIDLESPVGIVGFPSVGLVSSIAANYYVAQLEMTPVAGIGGPGMPPYCLVADNVAYPPVRMYGKKSRTKTGRDVVVCTSEYAPKPEDCYDVASAVLGEMRGLGCTDVICLEGIPRTSDEDEPVVCMGGHGGRRMAEASGLRIMDNGMIKGVSGVMLYQGAAQGMNITAIMCPANPAMPDPGSAVSFIEPLSKMVKGLKVSPKILMAEDEEIRRRAASEQASVEDPGNSAIYG